MTDEITITGGCRTVIANGEALAVTFTGPGGRLYFAITKDGDLKWGTGINGNAMLNPLADKLVDYFGKAYHSRLRVAEERAEKAEAKAKSASHDRDHWKDKAEFLTAEIEKILPKPEHAVVAMTERALINRLRRMMGLKETFDVRAERDRSVAPQPNAELDDAEGDRGDRHHPQGHRGRKLRRSDAVRQGEGGDGCGPEVGDLPFPETGLDAGSDEPLPKHRKPSGWRARLLGS
jgi:hypothetical protein